MSVYIIYLLVWSSNVSLYHILVWSSSVRVRIHRNASESDERKISGSTILYLIALNFALEFHV